jgi:ketosteroid isomerase-like protein
MSEANMELVFDHLNARRTRDLARLESQLDPDVVHQGVLPELVCHNRAEVLDNIRRSFRRDGFGVERLEMVDAGDHVVVGLAGPRFRDVPWAPLDGQIYVLYTLRDGRIVRMQDYLNRPDAMTAAGAGERDWQ